MISTKKAKKVGIINEDKVRHLIIPFLSVGKRGFKSKVCLVKVFLLVLKRMKTGCQWRELSIKEYFLEGEACWQTIYYYFHKWSMDGSFKLVWINLLRQHKKQLDLSSVQLDGSHTPCKRGGLAVGYQGRKSCKTSNSLFLCDNRGQMLAVASPQSGEHNDLYNLPALFKEMLELLTDATIDYNGIFLNAAAGFDCEELKETCLERGIELNVKPNARNIKGKKVQYRYFDEELYKRRNKIEHANAWIDSFKALIIRYEKRIETWWALQWMVLITLFARKIKV